MKRLTLPIFGVITALVLTLLVVNPAGADSTPYPTADTTGPVAGAVLRDVPGELTSGVGWTWTGTGIQTTAPNARVTRLRCACAVDVRHDGAIVGNNDILVSGEASAIELRLGARDVIVRHNYIHGPCVYCDDRLTYGINADLCQPPGGINSCPGLKVYRNRALMIDHPYQGETGVWSDNYGSELALKPTAPCDPDGSIHTADHPDVFFAGGGTPGGITLRHNTFLAAWHNPCTGTLEAVGIAAIMLNNAFGDETAIVKDCLVGGGNYPVYGGERAGPGNAVGVKITGNAFSTQFFPRSGLYGPAIYVSTDAARGNVFAGNFYLETGETVAAP